MKNKTMVAGLMVLCILAGVMISSRVDGDACVPGIKKEHLDATTGAFVDNSTIEISTSGVRVKDSGITAAKIADGAITPAKIANLLPTGVGPSTDSVTLPNGLKMAWGNTSIPGGSTRTITMDGWTKVLTAQVSPYVAAGGDQAQICVKSFLNNTFVLDTPHSGLSVQVLWLAIGY